MKGKHGGILIILPIIATVIFLSVGIIFAVGFWAALFRAMLGGAIILILCLAAKVIFIRYLPELIIDTDSTGENVSEQSDVAYDNDDVQDLNRSVFTTDSDSDTTAEGAPHLGAEYFAGEKNSASTRTYVDEEVQEKFTDESPEILARAIQTVLRQDNGEKTA